MSEVPSPVIEVIGLGKQVALAGGDREPAAEARLSLLDDVSFRIQPGEAVAIVGASGSGKSTLLGLLAGLDQASSGQIYLLGQELGALDEDQRAALRGAHIGFVFQSFQLLPALSALENVMLPLELAGQPSARARAQRWLERVGLGARLHHTPRQLSGGEQQRVALARAFVSGPSLLLADEPTGNLDAETGRSIIELIFELNREAGTTLVLVTHDAGLAARCDRVLQMREGRVEEQARELSANLSSLPASSIQPESAQLD